MKVPAPCVAMGFIVGYIFVCLSTSEKISHKAWVRELEDVVRKGGVWYVAYSLPTIMREAIFET